MIPTAFSNQKMLLASSHYLYLYNSYIYSMIHYMYVYNLYIYISIIPTAFSNTEMLSASSHYLYVYNLYIYVSYTTCMCTIYICIYNTNCLLHPGDAISFFTIHLYIQFIYMFYYTLHVCVKFIYIYISMIPTAFSNQEMLLASSPLPKYTAPT